METTAFILSGLSARRKFYEALNRCENKLLREIVLEELYSGKGMNAEKYDELRNRLENGRN